MYSVHRSRSAASFFAAMVVTGASIFMAGCGSGTQVEGLEVTPNAQVIAPGATVAYTINFRERVTANSAVSLRVTGVPSGATASFSPQVIPGNGSTSTLTVVTTQAIAEGSYSLRIFAEETGQPEKEIVALLTVSTAGTGADFTLEVQPDTFDFTGISGPQTFNYTVRSVNGFAGNVNVSLSVAGDDLAVSQSLNPTTAVLTSGSSATGSFGITSTPTPPVTSPVFATLTATSGIISHTRTVVITLPTSA